MAEGRVEKVFVPVRDGARLATTLYLPAGDEPAPCVLEALPYRKDDLTATYRPEYLRLRDEHALRGRPGRRPRHRVVGRAGHRRVPGAGAAGPAAT